MSGFEQIRQNINSRETSKAWKQETLPLKGPSPTGVNMWAYYKGNQRSRPLGKIRRTDFWMSAEEFLRRYDAQGARISAFSTRAGTKN
jgi:hypothetical protein